MITDDMVTRTYQRDVWNELEASVPELIIAKYKPSKQRFLQRSTTTRQPTKQKASEKNLRALVTHRDDWDIRGRLTSTTGSFNT